MDLNPTSFIFLLFVIFFSLQATHAVRAKFLLYTPENQQPEVITENKLGIKFNADLKLTLIVHGYMQNGHQQWIKIMRNELMKREQMNIVVVDWGPYSGWLYYTAVRNTRKVGSDIARLVHSIHKRHNYDVTKIHVIGHSLGAHIAGFAGAFLKWKVPGKKLGRITGLDPASPSFNHDRIRKRLDPSDAMFVDVIHTDIGLFGLGLARPCGHVDFYPNGGDNQPGCLNSADDWKYFNPKNLISLVLGARQTNFPLIWNTVCDHMQVINFFTASINSNCSRKAYKCDSWKNFQQSKCFRCERDACAVMGYDADQYHLGENSPAKYYLWTQGRDPFCGVKFNVYHVHLVNVTRGFKLFGGYSEVQVFLFGRNGTAVSKLPSYKVKYGTTQIHITIATTINPGELSSIALKYAGNLPLHVGRVTVKGPKNKYFAFFGDMLFSPHDYSNGRNRYKMYDARLRIDTVTASPN